VGVEEDEEIEEEEAMEIDYMEGWVQIKTPYLEN